MYINHKLRFLYAKYGCSLFYVSIPNSKLCKALKNTYTNFRKSLKLLNGKMIRVFDCRVFCTHWGIISLSEKWWKIGVLHISIIEKGALHGYAYLLLPLVVYQPSHGWKKKKGIWSKTAEVGVTFRYWWGVNKLDCIMPIYPDL